MLEGVPPVGVATAEVILHTTLFLLSVFLQEDTPSIKVLIASVEIQSAIFFMCVNF